MRRIRTAMLQPGMKTARNIYADDGTILLGAGMILNEYFIYRLKELGIALVYIQDDVFDSLGEISDVIPEEVRIQTVQEVKRAFHALESSRSINVYKVKDAVENILDELLANRDILVNLTDIRSYDNYTYYHSVNVCVLSLLTGITLGFNRLELKELGIGALMHDIGKTQIDKEMLNKSEQLSPAEYQEIQQHAVYGYQILRAYDDIPLLSAHIALQHHERWDGQGYPRHLAKNEIHKYARIVAVTDVYDALLSDRPYRTAYSVNQAVTILNRMANTHFEPRSLTAFISNIAIYPVGSVVSLNTGETGMVVDVNHETPTRPMVRVMFDRHQRKLTPPHEVDLSTFRTIYIARVLSEKDISRLKQSD